MSKENQSFVGARKHFEEIISWLKSPVVRGLSHSEIEEKLKVNGNEVLRQLWQGYLDQRATEKIVGECVDEEGEIHEQERFGSRKLMSIFGEVEIKRRGYRTKGKKTLQPLEAELNLPPEKYSHGVRKMIAKEVAKNGFDEVLKSVLNNSGATVAKRQLEACSRRASLDFSEYYQQKSVRRGDSRAEDLLIISVDGKGIIMREEDLRSGTKKKARAEKGKKSQHRLRPGEKRNRKRMATVATVYEIEANVRKASEIVNQPEKNPEQSREKKKKTPRAKNKRVWASVIQEPEQVIGEAFAEAKKRDPQQKQSWFALVDGNPTQINLLKKYARKESRKLTIILDLIHVIEYLWNAAHVFYTVGSTDAENWVGEKLLGILSGKVSTVASGMRRSATNRDIEEKKRKPVDRCANYLLKHKDYLRYNQYLEAGFPIATGVIEGACRYLVKDRMELTGARWSLQGAEAVLRLRALVASGDFESYWTFHLQQEYQRHHQSHYQSVPMMQSCYSGICELNQKFSHLI